MRHAAVFLVGRHARELEERDARRVCGRVLSAAVPPLLASLCMLALGPAGVRAMGLPLLAGTLCAASTATGLTGRVWARLRARRAGK